MLIAVCVVALILFVVFLMAWKIIHALFRLLGASVAALAFGAALWLYGEEIWRVVLP